MDNVIDKLDELETLLGGRGVWSKGALATDSRGFVVKVDSSNACKFCLLGGIERVCGKQNNTKLQLEGLINNSIHKLYGYSGVVNWNDLSRTRKKDVINVIRHAKETYNEMATRQTVSIWSS